MSRKRERETEKVREGGKGREMEGGREKESLKKRNERQQGQRITCIVSCYTFCYTILKQFMLDANQFGILSRLLLIKNL